MDATGRAGLGQCNWPEQTGGLAHGDAGLLRTHARPRTQAVRSLGVHGLDVNLGDHGLDEKRKPGGVRTELGSAAKVDEGPVVLDRPAEDVAGLDVAVSVAEAVQVCESPDRMV